jgi:hypothetical protein
MGNIFSNRQRITDLHFPLPANGEQNLATVNVLNTDVKGHPLMVPIEFDDADDLACQVYRHLQREKQRCVAVDVRDVFRNRLNPGYLDSRHRLKEYTSYTHLDLVCVKAK